MKEFLSQGYHPESLDFLGPVDLRKDPAPKFVDDVGINQHRVGDERGLDERNS
jgi:hypothetical protein